MTPIIAIDPGTTESAFVVWDGQKIYQRGILPNAQVLALLRADRTFDDGDLCIEMIASYGMAVGKEVFQTVLWIGRFSEAWAQSAQREARLIYRQEVKLHHCHSARAKDGNIRQALIDKYGAPGTKKAPGLTYGISSHLWSAFAIATYISETRSQEAVAA